jgi:hypothetical protein
MLGHGLGILSPFVVAEHSIVLLETVITLSSNLYQREHRKPTQMALLQSRVVPVSCSTDAAVKPTANMRMFVMPVRHAQRQSVQQQQQTARLASRGMLRGANTLR